MTTPPNPAVDSTTPLKERESFADPVAAFDRIAPWFGQLSKRRQAYLDAIDALVIDKIPDGSCSLLDVGAGDGRRARRIARQRGMTGIVLLEPSRAMLDGVAEDVRTLELRAEQLHLLDGRFDVITCLWNVLGHVFPMSGRVEVLRQFARLASPAGRIFIDVNHRYNLRHYGMWATAVRYLADRVMPGESRGNVTVTWASGDVLCETLGHVFNDQEFRRMCRKACLHVEARYVVDYETGKQQRWSCAGNLLYVLRP